MPIFLLRSRTSSLICSLWSLPRVLCENLCPVLAQTPWLLSPLLFRSCLSSRLTSELTTAAVNVSPIAISGQISTPSRIQGWVIFNSSRHKQHCDRARASKGQSYWERASWETCPFPPEGQECASTGTSEEEGVIYRNPRLSYHPWSLKCHTFGGLCKSWNII